MRQLISCLLLIITLYFTCGETKNWWNIQKFQNIMSMVVVSFPDSWANHYRNCFFQQDYICFSKTIKGFAKVLYSFFITVYLSICKDRQKTIILLSGPFLQIFTFTIQCICNLWWIESSLSETIPWYSVQKTGSKVTVEQHTHKRHSNKAVTMYLYWNHTSTLVPPPL